MRDSMRHRCHVDLDAPGITTLGTEKMVNQRAVAAANIQHVRSGLNHAGDQREVDSHVLGQEADRVHGAHAARPACIAQPFKNPASVRWKSGSSNRNASWPLSVGNSTNDTFAPARFNARAIVRLSVVGNSQSDVKEANRKRVRAPLKAAAKSPPQSA